MDSDSLVKQILEIVSTSIERSYLYLVSGFRDMALREFRTGLLTGLLLTKVYCREGVIDDSNCIDLLVYISTLLSNSDDEKLIIDLYTDSQIDSKEEVAIAI